MSVLLSAFIGVVAGVLAGYWLGRIDEREKRERPQRIRRLARDLEAIEVGSHGNQSLSEAGGSAQSAAQKNTSSTCPPDTPEDT